MKDKTIEEMARIIDDRLIEANGVIGSMNNGKGCWIAQKLVEHYQPKLPEGSVVLSREEYGEIKIYQSYIPEMKKAFDKIRNAAIKETAERDFNHIIKALEIKKASIITHYGVKESVGADVAIRTVKELAKQFGVDLKGEK